MIPTCPLSAAALSTFAKCSGIFLCVILMAKNNVDGVYSADPKLDESAVKFDEISYSDVLAKDLKVMDQTAITLCKDNDIDLCVFNMQEDGNIAKACDGQKIGTTISGGK